MATLTDKEAEEIEEGIPSLRGPILITWIRRLLADRRARIASAQRPAPSRTRSTPAKETPMSTATLTFTLPEESNEHRAALDGGAVAAVVSGLRERLRKARKYEGRQAIPVEEVEAWIVEEAADRGVHWLLE